MTIVAEDALSGPQSSMDVFQILQTEPSNHQPALPGRVKWTMFCCSRWLSLAELSMMWTLYLQGLTLQDLRVDQQQAMRTCSLYALP